MTTTIDRAPAPTRATEPETWVYRPELDGLRTVAVYLVVLFHGRVSAFSGGFIGVDLFFVLSGFLVSSILFEEVATRGRIDVIGFFARRVRRLLPAALVVVLATSVVSVLTSTVVARLSWIGDAQSALLYVSNWHFLAESRDYFSPAVDTSPFLHFWSLSIEEQFYVGFALVLLAVVAATRRTRRWAWAAGAVVGLLTVASVLSQLYWAAHDPSRAYYATDARIYQLLVGVLGALLWRLIRAHAGSRVRRPRRGHPGIVLLLLGLLVVAATPVAAVTASTRGLIATAVAAPMIVLVMTGVDPAARWFLSRPVMTYLGRISYGTYLWHWPMVLTLRQLFDSGPLVIVAMTATLSTGMAALSYEVLEHPIRRSRVIRSARLPVVVAGIGLSTVLAVTVVPRVLGSARAPAVSSRHERVADTVLPTGAVPRGLPWAALSRERGLDDTYCTPTDPRRCLVHQGSGPRVLVVGDSHGRVLGEALRDLARKHDFTLYASVISACSWFPHTTSPTQDESQRQECHLSRDHLFPDLVRALHIDVVVLTQMPRPWLRSDAQPDLPYPRLASQATRAVTASIESTGAKTVIVTSMLKTIDDPLGCLSAARDESQCEMVQSVDDDPFDAAYLTAAADNPDVATIDVNRVMCPGYPLCAAVLDGLPVWRDHLHYLPGNVVRHDGQIWAQLVATGFFSGTS